MNSHQNPATSSVAKQVNPVTNQQMCNVGGLYPNNNTPIVASPCFMNFPFPVQYPNGVVGGFNQHQNFSPFPPVNQFNPSPQQQSQMFVHNPMNPNQNLGLPHNQHQLLMQNTIQNISQLLQLQNPNYQCLPGNFPMFQNQIGNVLSHQNPGFPVNHQNMGQQLQGNPFLPGASASVQTPTLTNFQNQVPQGVGPQYNNFHTNQIPNTVQTQTHCSTLASMKNVNRQENNGNVPTNVNGGRAESQHKNFTGHKTNDASHKGLKTHKHVKEKFGTYNGYKNKDGNSSSAVDPGPRSSTNFEKKIPPPDYTEQEITQWREARKKSYPTNANILKKCKKGQTLSDVTNPDATFRRQQLKEVLAKQAELGCEVAEIPPSYLNCPDKQNPRDEKHERQQYKKGKFQRKRGTPKFQDRIGKKVKRSRDQNSSKHKPKEREPSLLQKLLTRDIKRDKNHLLQVLRFITLNSFFTSTDKSLRFPRAIVKEETNLVVPKETPCLVEGNNELDEEEEGEITD